MSEGQDLLYQIVHHMFPGAKIVQNTRPWWLFGLELDIYLPDKHLAFEFDGPQHRFPVGGMYKGEEMFEYSSKNDHWKNKTCKGNGVKLFRVSARTLKPVRVKKMIIDSAPNGYRGVKFRRFPVELEKQCATYRYNHAYTKKEKEFRRNNHGTISPVGNL